MESNREAQQLLDLCAEELRLLQELYEAYAQQFPHCVELWGQLLKGEGREAAQFARFKELLEAQAFSYAPGGLHVSGMKTHVETLRQNVEKHWRTPRSLDHALELAAKAERNLLGRELFASFSTDDVELRGHFRRLARSTSEQSKLLRQATLRRTKYLGLVERGLISSADLERAQEQARVDQVPVSRVLTTQFGLPKGELVKHLRDYFGVPCYQTGVDAPPSAALIQEFTPLCKVLRRELFAPVAEDDDCLVVAVEDPKDLNKRDVVSAALVNKRRIQLQVATPDDIQAAIELYYTPSDARRTSLSDVILELGLASDTSEERQILVSEEDTAVVRLVNRLIEDAVTRGASDIHIEPSLREAVQVRLRIDGELGRTVTIPRQLQRVVVARLKIMSGLDIAERRKPQSGKISFRHWGKLDVELRLEIYPTVAGEDAVLRILAEKQARTLGDLKLLPDTEANLRGLLENPYGLLLCVGPTGSGKTTTLHSALAHLLEGSRKILTVEDPVEITQDGLRQVQVNIKAGLTFAVALRSFLRSDPDVIMVGEMRDLETASIAVASSLTGHLVLSTLHTNNAPETVTRLIDMGLDRFTFSDALLGVLAQRLVRSLCERCSLSAEITPSASAAFEADYGEPGALERLLGTQERRWKTLGKGCPACSNRGYRGRLGVHELMPVNDALRHSICQGASARELRAAAVAASMRTLRQDGLEKVLAGWTTPEEVRAATSR